MDTVPEAKRYLIADDLCDGGRSFLELSKIYHAQANGTGPLDLWVTHGIFSKGLGDLNKAFNRIGCTDSFPPYHLAFDTGLLTVIKILDHLTLRTTQEETA